MRLNSSLKTLRIAARQSDLARLQAYHVGESLKAAWPDLEVEYSFRASLGDINQNDPLWRMPEKGVFTEDFLKDLREGSADLIVHSWKDLPIEERADTEIVATLPRADARDLLLFRSDRLKSARETGRVRILTSSPRRSYNLDPFLRSYLPFHVNELTFEPVRGNIPTRLKKLLSQDVEALVVAKAALDRLLAATQDEFAEARIVIREALSKTRFMVLPFSYNPTAAAQGALAIEIRRDRDDLRGLLKSIHCEKTFQAVLRERRILASYGGGCHQKIGISVLPREYGEISFLRGLTDQGKTLDSVELISSHPQPKAKTEEALYSPPSGADSRFFDREPLTRDQWSWAEKEKFLWVARANAWPEDLSTEPDAIVWAAGLHTWKKLAERGIWVSGSSESLGEQESPGLESLLDRKDIPWVKLSHRDSAQYEGEATGHPVCATYRLVPRADVKMDVKGCTHFYWPSASSFAEAFKKAPEIRSGHHACGPGTTLRYLRKVLGPEASIAVHLSVEGWRQAVLSN